jgi:hypothetical protein
MTRVCPGVAGFRGKNAIQLSPAQTTSTESSSSRAMLQKSQFIGATFAERVICPPLEGIALHIQTQRFGGRMMNNTSDNEAYIY